MFLLKITVHAVLDPDALSICTVFWKNQVGKMKLHEVSNWIFTACVACKNQFGNWFLQVKNPVCRTWFFKLDFLKIKYRWIGLLCMYLDVWRHVSSKGVPFLKSSTGIWTTVLFKQTFVMLHTKSMKIA